MYTHTTGLEYTVNCAIPPALHPNPNQIAMSTDDDTNNIFCVTPMPCLQIFSVETIARRAIQTMRCHILCALLTFADILAGSSRPGAYRANYMQSLYLTMTGENHGRLERNAAEIESAVTLYLQGLGVTSGAESVYLSKNYLDSQYLPNSNNFPLAIHLNEAWMKVEQRLKTVDYAPVAEFEFLLAAIRMVGVAGSTADRPGEERVVFAAERLIMLATKPRQEVREKGILQLFDDICTMASERIPTSELHGAFVSSAYQVFRRLLILHAAFQTSSNPTLTAMHRFERVLVRVDKDPSAVPKAIEAMDAISTALSGHLMNLILGLDDTHSALRKLEWINRVVDTRIETQLYDCAVMLTRGVRGILAYVYKRFTGQIPRASRQEVLARGLGAFNALFGQTSSTHHDHT